jgi:hypothetical protein
MSSHPQHNAASGRAAPNTMRLVPTPPPPDRAARERFAKRRAAGQIAEAIARAVGRSSAEAGTARLATLLAADAGVLRIAAGEPAADSEPAPSGPTIRAPAVIPAGTQAAIEIRSRSRLLVAAGDGLT